MDAIESKLLHDCLQASSATVLASVVDVFSPIFSKSPSAGSFSGVQLSFVMEEGAALYIANKGDLQLKPFVEDRIGEFEEAWAAFKVALGTV